MSRKRIVECVLTAALCLALAGPGYAGGWAVVTLDELPRGLETHRPTRIGFMVRQHGVTPMAGLSPKIHLWQSQAAERIQFAATPEGKPGHYAATVTLPSAGTWEWEIDAFGSAQRMPVLAVGGDTQVSDVGASPVPPWLLLGVATFALLVGGALASALKRTRLATGLLVAVALTGAAGIVAWRAASAAPTQDSIAPTVAEGQALFLAKGCVVCHEHVAFHQLRAEMGLEGFSVGPDLSGRTFSHAYLASWLENPQAIKPYTLMPNLDLSPEEIAALTEFINTAAGE